MRGLLVIVAIVLYLFLLVFIESELVKLEVREEQMRNHVIELKNEKKLLEFEVMKLGNLANIEIEAKQRGFVYPKDDNIVGVIR